MYDTKEKAGVFYLLTPLDIENKRFKKEVFGYSQAEVEEFLLEVSQDYERIYKDNTAARDRIEMLTDAIKQYKSMEETLQNAMIVAQSAGDEIKKNAQVKAEQIIKEAEFKAQQIIADAGTEVTKVSYQYEEIKRNIEMFRGKMVALLNSQLEIIKDYSANEDFHIPEHTVDSIVSQSVSDGGKIKEVDLPRLLEDVNKITNQLPKVDLLNEDLDEFMNYNKTIENIKTHGES